MSNSGKGVNVSEKGTSFSDWTGTILFFGIFCILSYVQFGNEISAWGAKVQANVSGVVGDGLSPLGAAALVVTVVAVGVLLDVARDGYRTLENGAEGITGSKGNGVGRNHRQSQRIAATMRKVEDNR